MSQKWSNSRSGSRPTGAGLGFSPRVPTFQPPSYYAAAAGLSPRADLSQPKEQHPEEPLHAYNPLSGGPLSYPTANADVDDPRTSEPTPSNHRKRSLSRSFSRAIPKSHKDQDARPREGSSRRQMAEIPFLETQLLPSLRDTIDKMTHPPTRAAAQDGDERRQEDSENSDGSAVTHENKARILVVSAQESRASRSPVVAPGYVPTHASTPRGYASSTPTTPAVGSVLSPHLLGTPSLNANRSDQPLSPRAASKIPASPRLATKSSLRVDPPNNAQLSPMPYSSLLSPPVDKSPGRSLRSVKSIVPSSEVTQSPRAPLVSKLRSPNVQVVGPSKLPTASSSSRSRAQSSTPRTLQQLSSPQGDIPRSNLPRPNTDSSSELEREYNKRLAAGRLIVANAEVIPSSSESEREEPIREPTWTRTESSNDHAPGKASRALREPAYNHPPRIQQRTPAAVSYQSKREDKRISRYAPSVGLGLQGYPEFERAEASSGSITEDDDVNVYESEDPGEEPHEPEPERDPYPREHRRHHPYQGHSRAREEMNADRYPSREEELDVREDYRRSSNLPPSDSRRRREQALVGLVDGLQLESSRQGRPSPARHGVDRDQRRRSGEDRSHMDDYVERDDKRRSSEPSRKGKESNRKRVAVQPSRLPASSMTRQDSDCAGPSGQQWEHRRSMSVPPKSRRSSRNDNLPLVTRDSPQLQRDEYQDENVASEPPLRKSRHRNSASTPQSSGRRRSVVEDTPSASERPSGRRRSSTYAADTQSTRGSHTQDRKQDPAALERVRFGIPESLSYSGYDVHPEVAPGSSSHQHDRHDTLDHQDDYSVPEEDPRLTTAHSTPDLDRWQEQNDSGSFSTAAQALFSKLSGRSTSREGDQSSIQDDQARRMSGSSRPALAHSRTRSSQHAQEAQRPALRHSGTLSASSSAPSIYEPELEPEPDNLTTQPEKDHEHPVSWRATLRPADYDALLRTHGQGEMDRQELIYHYFCVHFDFVRRLRSTVRVFIVPLRRKHSKVWLPGVPKEVARLFDWLEDIVNVHCNIADTLAAATEPWHSGDIVRSFARAIRGFVPRFEIYQPYLVRVDDVRLLLADSVAARDDEFGEFLRLREAHPDCENRSLGDLLLEPVEHLYGSVETFKELWRLTPSSHPDHLPSLSLYQSTRTIVHVLHEVKIREEEYEFVKDMSKHIDGLLPSVQLARRERRLLWHGELVYHPSPKAEAQNRRNSYAKTTPSALSSSSNSRPGAHRTPTIIVSPCPDSPALDEKQWSKSMGKKAENSTSAQPVAVQVSVFTDVLLLTEAIGRRDSDGGERFKLLLDVGISKVLDLSLEEASGNSPYVTLSLLPLGQSDLHTGVIPESSIAISVRLSLRATPGEDRANALNALRRCHAYTLCSLAFPSHAGTYLPHGPQVDLEADTQRSVMDILHTGLPLPKSPSLQMRDNLRLDANKGLGGGKSTGGVEGKDAREGRDAAGDVDREREERGWWTLRFQQVLREVQRRDPMLSLAVFGD